MERRTVNPLAGAGARLVGVVDLWRGSGTWLPPSVVTQVVEARLRALGYL